MAAKSLNAKKREITTKGALTTLRKEGFVPGVIYSKDHEPVSLSIADVELRNFVFSSKTHIIDLSIDGGEAIKCVVKDVQFDPLTDKVSHVDLVAVKMDAPVQVPVMVRTVGSAEGVKKGGRLQQFMHKLVVECMPADLPEILEINVTQMGLGATKHVRNLSYDNLKIVTPEDVLVVACVAGRGVTADKEK